MKAKYFILLASMSLCGRSEKSEELTPVKVAEQYIQGDKEIDLLFFAPDEGRIYKNILLGLIEQEKKSIKAALFRLTDKKVMQALIDAHTRGVSVEVIFDPGAVTTAYYSLALQLRDAGIQVYHYQAIDLFTRRKSKKTRKVEKEKTKYQTLMHQKTFIFEDTFGRKIVAFGSLNPTTAGFHGNEEAIQIRNKSEIVEGFEKQFERVKKRSNLSEPDWSKMRRGRADSVAYERDLCRPSLLQSLLS